MFRRREENVLPRGKQLTNFSPLALLSVVAVAVVLSSCGSSSPILPNGTTTGVVHWIDPTTSSGGSTKSFSGTLDGLSLQGSANVSYQNGFSVHSINGELGSTPFRLTVREVGGSGLVCSANNVEGCVGSGTQPPHFMVSGHLASDPVTGTLTPNDQAMSMAVSGTVAGSSISAHWEVPVNTCCAPITTSITITVQPN